MACLAGDAAIVLQALDDALRRGDLDAALAQGLLGFDGPLVDAARHCPCCAPRVERVVAARDARRVALAARERHRARQARLARRAQAREERRAGAAASGAPGAAASTPPAALPPAAAAALARAKARARPR